MRALWAIILWPGLLLAQEVVPPISAAKPMPEGLTFIEHGQHDPRLKGYRTPHGFQLEIVTDDAFLSNPVAFTFAPDGTLYVIERTPDRGSTEESATVTYKDGQQRRIRVSTKKTKDVVQQWSFDAKQGRYTQKTTLLEDAFPTNILVHDGWLYVAGQGTIRRWSLRDVEGGKNQNAKPHMVLQGLAGGLSTTIGLSIGADGWLYVTASANDHVVEGSDGQRATVLRSGAVFRCQPDGSKLEVWAKGLAHSTSALVHHDRGQALVMDQHGDDGRLLHVVDGGDYGGRSDVGRLPVGEPAGTLAPILSTGRSSPAGLLYYNEQQWPPFYRRWLYSPDPVRRTVRAWKPIAVGSTFEVQNELALLSSNDPSFCPSQIATGPDGAIYVLDTRTPMDRTGPALNYRQHGRLLRLSWGGGQVPDDPEPHERIERRSIETWSKLASANVDALVEALQGTDATVRIHAQRELLRRKDDAIHGHFLRLAGDTDQALETRLLCFASFYARWEAKSRELVLQHLHDQEPLISEACAELLGRMVTARDEEAVRALDKLLADSNKAVRRRAALALGRINGSGTIDALFATYRADDGKDALLTNGLVRAIERTGKAGVTKLLELARSGNDAERDKCVQAFLAFRTNAGAEVLPELLVDPHLNSEQQVALVASYAQYAFEPPWSLAKLPAILQTNTFPTPVLATAITILADARQTNHPGCLELVKRVLNDDQPALHWAVVQAIEAAEWTEALPLVRPFVAEPHRIELRTTAVRALRRSSKEVVPTMVELTKPSEPVAIRIEAFRTLNVLDRKTADTVARAWLKDKDASLLREAIAVLGATHDGATFVAETMARGELTRDTLPPVVDGLRRHIHNTNDRQLLTKTLQRGLLQTNNQGEVEKVRQLVLSKGDASRGRALYLHANNVGCVRCHTMEGLGGMVGPDLTKLWDTDTIEKIIAALLDPSQHIRDDYATTKVITKDQTIVGRKISDTKEAVVLRDATGQDVRVTRSAIVSLDSSPRSLMPDDLASSLSFEQFIDLVAFLKNRSAQESLRGVVKRYRVASTVDVQRPPEQGGPADWQTIEKPNGALVSTTAEAKPVYAMFVAHAPQATTTTLYLTSNDAVRVWVNGKLVFDRTPRLTPSDHEERVAIELRAGANDVLLRTEGTTPKRLAVRLALFEGLRLSEAR